MKIRTFLLLILNIIVCKAQIVNVSSPSLKYWIISSTVNNSRAKDLNGNWLKIDQNDDGELQLSEAQNIGYFADFNGNTSSYDCIQSFTNLEELYCYGNGWAIGIDLSYLVQLKKIDMHSNNLTSIVVNGCLNLEEINVRQNSLTSLNLNGLSNLNKLDCAHNIISSLNFNDTPNLKYIDCTANSIYSLNLNNLLTLETLYCGQNNLINLNVTNNINLKSLVCASNYLTSLNISNLTLLEWLFCSNNNLGILNLSNCPNLTSLACAYSGLNTLDTNNLPLLETLYCNNNSISTLNLINNPNLKSIRCYNNNLGPNSLNLTNQSVLETLLCYQNNLTTLDVSNCPNLNNLDCQNNLNLANLNINNGFDWVPNNNFHGDGLPHITQICTSTNSIPAIQGFYNFHNLYPSITNCNVLNVIENNGIISKEISFSPNPAQDEVIFSEMVYSVIINDINGRLIKISVVNGTKMDISDLKEGFYIINIESENSNISSKLIVK